jgi:hypothetical protein
MGEPGSPAKRVRAIFTLIVAWIIALAPSDTHAEQPFSLFLLPPLVDDLIEMALPFRVDSELGPDRSIRFWILESRYCGARADGSGKFVAIAVPDVTPEGKALRTLSAEDCRRSLGQVARASSKARHARAWIAAISLHAVWNPSRLQWKLMGTQTASAGDGSAPAFSVPSGGLTIAEFATRDVRIAIDEQLDLTVQLAPAFFDDFARVSVSRAPLKSAPDAGRLDRSGAPRAARAIALLPHEAVTSILQQDLIQQELVFNHSVSGEQRFLIQKASVSSPGPETYALSGQSLHVGTDETFTVDVVFRGNDLLVESMTLRQQLDDCGAAPPVSEFNAFTDYTECMAEFALRRGAAKVGSALLTQAYQRHRLRPTGSPTPLQVWLGNRHFAIAVSILKASVQGDALALYLEPSLGDRSTDALDAN